MRRAWAVLALLLVPAGARSQQEIIIQARQELELWHDTDLDESVADERLDIYAGYGDFSVQTTFLIHQPTNATRLDPSDYGEPFEGVRKRMLEARVGPFTAQLGNVYTTLGRGVGLQLIENQIVDFDNGVDGFRTVWDDSRWHMELLAGRNSYGEREASLKTASAGWAGLRNLNVMLHATQVDSSEDAAGRMRGRDRVGGGELGYQLPWADVHASYFIRDFEPGSGRAPADGHAAYGAASVYWGPAALTVEGKDYLRYDWGYTIPPPGVRQHTTTLLNRTSHTVNFSPADSRGYQAEFLINLLAGDMEFIVNRAAGENRDGDLPYFEDYAQLEYAISDDIIAIARLAESEETVDEGAKVIFFERITGGGNIYWALADTWAIELDFETQKKQEQDLAVADVTFPAEARDNIITVNLFHAPWLAMAVTHEWTNDPRETEKDSWTFAEVNVQVLDRHQINFGGGAFRGGQLCSGGICRPIAPFTGARVNWLTTF